MGEKNGDAKTFWMDLEDDGKVDFIFEQVQNVLQSLKQKIKDGSATNKEYIQAMILVNEATISNNSTLIKDHISVTQNEQENKSGSLPSTSYEDSFPEDCTSLSAKNKEIPPLENKVAYIREKKSFFNLPYRSHDCSRTCLMKTPLTFKGENPLQLPIKCHFQRRHAKTNSHSSALHVSYKTPCGRSLRNVEEVFRYLLETECNYLFTDNFSFNTYVQLTRNYPKQEEIVSDVDISNGVESVPISFCNEIDNRKLPHFKYRRTVWPRAYYLTSFSNMFTDSCDCSEGCIDITKCACLQLTARNAKTCPLSSNKITTGYKYKRLQRQIPSGIYECSLLCKCNRRICQNRVVQHGPQVRLQVFKTEKKGWGVRCLDDIDRGTFVCIYSGRLLSRSNVEKPGAATDENGKDYIMKNMFSKKRKIEVADCEVEVIPLDLETHNRNAATEECPPVFNNNIKEPVTDMKCNSISRIQYHSVIRSPKVKTVIIQRNGKRMGFASSESVTSEDNDGFKPTQVHLNSNTKEMKSVFQVAEKMEKRTCALCPKDIEYSVLYFAQSENIAAHENCLLYSSALVECEDHDPRNQDRNFDVESVKKEIHRGRKLTCAFCNRRGATVGCDVKACNRSYHFFCAKNDHAVLQTDGLRGIYKVFCQQHAPGSSANDLLPGNSLSAAFHPQDNPRTKRGRGVKRKRGKRPLSTGIHAQPPNAMTLNRLLKHMKDEDGRHTDATVKIDFLKKCKEAGLLNDLFEEILDKLHLIQERLMGDTASDSDYEEIGTSLFDCRLFDDTFVNFQAAIQRKIHRCEERQQQLKEELEALQDLNHIMYFTHKDRDARSSSLSVSSVSSKDYPFQNQE
ncbi:histone-lysine N-methyltransferase SETDB2 isoform X9 [Canis lupus dingo]|uniref:histone-lysine N-methyltransferase SETDB2 isoform X9 n=1 Tax=Canis lupus dingo TaxID=286419 RepID=UPI0015F149E9|nr:histone-lysine N-methyltransferase SETDB2 isoform X9 [Canis lupus dingo]XP_038286805.1 histone-lysine N-methyltransferase SETDB2 isoform X8 [Canis lupus familiaris]